MHECASTNADWSTAWLACSLKGPEILALLNAYSHGQGILAFQNYVTEDAHI